MDILPYEVIEYIALQDHKIWLLLVQVYKFLAEKSYDQNYKDDLMRKFLQRREKYKDFEIAYCLPNRVLHNYEEPSINKFGNKYWYQHDELHRDNDLPAI